MYTHNLMVTWLFKFTISQSKVILCYMFNRLQEAANTLMVSQLNTKNSKQITE